MNDQARQLRELVIQESLQRPDQRAERVTYVWFCSGRAGAGTTTVALNVAVALARMGPRVVFVAGSGNDEKAAPFDGLFEPLTRPPHESIRGSLLVGPFGLNLFVPLPGSSSAQQPLRQIADFILIDAGYAGKPPEPSAAETTVYVYVTTTDNSAILDTYALMKSQPLCDVGFIVANQADVEGDGWYALERFSTASGDFSDRRISPAAVIPYDHNGQLCLHARPVVLQSPTSTLARCFDRVAERLCESKLPDRRVVSARTGT